MVAMHDQPEALSSYTSELADSAIQARQRAAVFCGLVLVNAVSERILICRGGHEALVLTGIAAGVLSGYLALANAAESIHYRHRADNEKEGLTE
jgi:hypothetical protein